ncbi:L-type lectin-like domain-containing protein [Neolecta irregularis DAH-3]|uniref:L-type lectin-like domain-containing protein n=1 Tax=Neolecta irregularis (strain DAH-3) TaxID=1198029 RepID=A0A1U7LP72_NEOID|nr:L-type lectin-like domain-containing protein [Neolecta irregularis DAH-3]|eukprot:OLL24428.1 L-type lectin-like domain-containing protein [Neolecta irregularis DAH-3]
MPLLYPYAMRLTSLLLSSALTFVIAGDPRLSLTDFHDLNAWDQYGSVQVYSDRAILSAYKSHVGALWAKLSNPHEGWVAEYEIKVDGPEYGGGKGIALWYTSERGKGGLVYGNQDKWDGLGLFIESSSNGRSILNGHLNDGSIEYTKLSQSSLQAFSSCALSYRNRGRQIIKVQHVEHSLRVEVDGKLCFETNQVVLPVGYYFGISAASADLPDTHELYSISVTPAVRADEAGASKQLHPDSKYQGQDIRMSYEDLNSLKQDLSALKQQVVSITQSLSKLEQIDRSISELALRIQRIDQHTSVSHVEGSRIADRMENLGQSMSLLERRLAEGADHLISVLPKHLSSHVAEATPNLFKALGVLFLAQLIIFAIYRTLRSKQKASSKKYL